MRNAVPKVDIGILTFREDELAAVLARFPPEEVFDGRRLYNLSRVPLEGGASYTVAIVRCLEEMDKGDAAAAVRDFVEELAPRLLLMVGIAVGMPSEKITLGDIVIATHIVDANNFGVFSPNSLLGVHKTLHKEMIKWAANLPALLLSIPNWYDDCIAGTPTIPFEFSSTGPLQEAVILSLSQHFPPQPYRDSLGKLRRIKDALPRVVTGRVVTTESRSISDASISESVWANVGANVLAFEEDAFSVYSASEQYELPTMSIRGIGQMLGMPRDARWIRHACAVAAAFARAFLGTRPIEPHTPAEPASVVDEASPDRLVDIEKVFRASHLVLTDVRGFQYLDLALKAPSRSDDGGQWTILLGDNGVGKTTILRSLALTLSPRDVTHAVLSRLGSHSPTVRADRTSAVIRLGTPEHEDVTTLVIEPFDSGERLRRRSTTDIPMPFVVAYGSRRGSGLGGSGRGTDLTPLAAVETLFDEGANLIQPDIWLKEWKLAELQGGKESADARFFNAILATLCDLLPGVEKVHVSREAVEVEGPALGRVPLGALSDGYRTTMGWVLDMVARWAEEAKRRNLPVDEGFAGIMTGVAIVDEIDLHLHPRWQRDVVASVRARFPRMSFVVTTHNPLTLLGARPGEIYVLRRNEQGNVDVMQRDLPPGSGAEQILTGDWFGLVSTLDDETLRLLDEHRRLIRDRGPDAPEVIAREQELRQRLGSFADTSIERLAHSAAAQVIEEDIRTLTPEQREEAQEKIAALLRKKPATVKSKPKARRSRSSAG
jgi:nucleoside phosphorylase/energy-coupling factor transporter ATP-binding protein EcfA2